MSMQVLPTAPSPTVTHLMNLEAVAAIEQQQQQQVLIKGVFLLNLTDKLRERESECVCVCTRRHFT